MIEQTLIFGPDSHLVGTVTLPAQTKPGHQRTMALLTNAGVIPRIGPHRLNVRLARRFAELGLPTLRFDMSGLGDSRRSSSRRSTGEQFVADTVSAMDLAQAKFGCDRFIMVGFCSGGDVAHTVALEDGRLRAIVMWDSYVYATRQAKIRGLVHRLRSHSMGTLARKAMQRLLAKTNKMDAAQAGQAAEGPSIFGRTWMPPRDDFGQRIRTLVDRGVELMFLFSGGEPQWYNYRAQFRDMFSSYGFVDRVEYDYMIRSDHTFIQPHAQDALVNRVERWLEQRVLPRWNLEQSETVEIVATHSAMVAA
jgi:pimeloyl-ACP methyl ester carboxylesterase